MTKDEQRAAQEDARKERPVYPGPFLYLSPSMREQFIKAGFLPDMIRIAPMMVLTDD